MLSTSLLFLPHGSSEPLSIGKGFPGQPATPSVHSTCIPQGSVSALWFIFCLHMSCLPAHPVRARAALKNTTSPHIFSLHRISGLSSSVSLHIPKASFPQCGLSLALSPHHIGLLSMLLLFWSLCDRSLLPQPGWPGEG